MGSRTDRFRTRAEAVKPTVQSASMRPSSLCVPNTHPIRSRHEPVLVNQSLENLATS